jgi:mannose-6-phosphate isomerase-like protein (cupin superfamily)
MGTGMGTGPDAAVDAAGLDEDTMMALIGAAMTQLAPVANQCWAAGATDDYQLAGTVTLTIKPRPGGAQVDVASDTTNDKVLKDCLVTVTTAFGWPQELIGEVIEIPFEFTAPNGQYVIDRQLVPYNGREGVAIGVVIDEKNTGNGAASVLSVIMKDGAGLALAKADRHEVWYVLDGVGVVKSDKKPISPIEEGFVIDVPAGAYREILASQTGLKAVVFLVPGQGEGTARAGAMPSDTLGGAGKGQPRVIEKDAAKAYTADKRVVRIYLDTKAKGGPKDVALSVLELEAGAAVPEHVHADETEVLYVVAGDGEMVIDGVTLPVTDSTTLQVPKGVKHQATVTKAIRAIQLYTPGGPEQRFKAKAK